MAQATTIGTRGTEPFEKEVQARTPTPDGHIIRLRGVKRPNGDWVDHVELATADGELIQHLCSGYGLRPTQVYNALIDPLIDDRGEPVYTTTNR